MPEFKPVAPSHSPNPDELSRQDATVILNAFDERFYLEKYPDVAANGFEPLLHYLTHGWLEGRDPSPHFSTSYYLAQNPDVANSGNNPFWHYLTIGQHQGRAAKPSLAEQAGPPPGEVAVVEPFFDAAFYLAENADVADAGFDPLTHYLSYGWREGRDPSQEFSTDYYLSENPDVVEAGVNPLWHFAVTGKDEGRAATPRDGFSGQQDSAATEQIAKDAFLTEERIVLEMNAIRDEFDTVYYLGQYPDVSKAGVDPLLHFVLMGWQEGRNPNSEFSVNYYLEANPDVKNAGFNPFWHYVMGGRAEGRDPRHPGGYVAEKLIGQRPLEDIVNEWRTGAVPSNFLDVQALYERVMAAAGPGHDKALVLSIGHDNYRENSGGIQYCIQREEELSAENNAIYLNLHPFQPLPRLAHPEEDPDVTVDLVLGRENLGSARMSDVIAATNWLATELPKVNVIVHHLMGHSLEQVIELVKATGHRECLFWTHDFFSICPSYALQRNDVAFCGAPSIGSNACTLCLYGEERKSHQGRMKALFEELDVSVISPSEFCADLWQKRSGLKPRSLRAHPHVSLEWDARIGSLPEPGRQITIAYLGFPVRHKGWPVFETLLKEFKSDDRFTFVYLGSNPPPTTDVKHVPVSVSSDKPEAMVDALVEEQVDLVLHWASCAETFSFATFEALAGGAHVLTNPDSGNVAATVLDTGRGAVLNHEEDLMAFLTDGRAEAMVAEIRSLRSKEVARRAISAMSFDFAL